MKNKGMVTLLIELIGRKNAILKDGSSAFCGGYAVSLTGQLSGSCCDGQKEMMLEDSIIVAYCQPCARLRKKKIQSFLRAIFDGLPSKY